MVDLPEPEGAEKMNYLETLVQMIKKSNNIDLKNLNRLEKLSEEAISIIKEPENIQKSIENALNKVFLSEFDSSILLDGEEEGFISLYENSLKLIEIKVTKDNRIHLLDNIEPIEIKDATFIESPLILNNHDLLIRSQSGLNLNKRNIDRLGIPYTTLHTKDLFDKLKKLSFNIFFEDDFEEIFRKEISNIVNGEIVYDNDKKDFVYRKDNKLISIKNTASGIKSFGIVQLLILNRVINSNSILILDEPENHLHPKWQLKFAKILTELAKNNIYILVTSHSPYMIEALKRYSENNELKEKTNFYLAEDRYINNEDRLGDIFSILSEPFEVFRKMDEELLKDE
jgi:predicted ATP-dependent endonuclease of OLD family